MGLPTGLLTPSMNVHSRGGLANLNEYFCTMLTRSDMQLDERPENCFAARSGRAKYLRNWPTYARPVLSKVSHWLLGCESAKQGSADKGLRSERCRSTLI